MGGEDSEHYARFKSFCCQVTLIYSFGGSVINLT